MKREKIPRSRALASRPIINPSLQWTRADDGEVVITLPRRTEWWAKLLSILFVVPKQKDIALDEIGSTVWDMMDGTHTVGEIAESLARKYGLRPREAEVALFEYLKTLARRRIIALEIPVD